MSSCILALCNQKVFYRPGAAPSATPPAVLTSQPITVQIQQTEQGTRLMIPTGQLPGFPDSFFFFFFWICLTFLHNGHRSVTIHNMIWLLQKRLFTPLGHITFLQLTTWPVVFNKDNPWWHSINYAFTWWDF